MSWRTTTTEALSVGLKKVGETAVKGESVQKQSTLVMPTLVCSRSGSVHGSHSNRLLLHLHDLSLILRFSAPSMGEHQCCDGLSFSLKP
mmetsp:Transcript_19519/g.30991  ORF Transcript_19519/g.30991 Transcript_19519/m.30991 type:complete len:89 (+) Transcript_19519:813-1079(+)